MRMSVTKILILIVIITISIVIARISSIIQVDPSNSQHTSSKYSAQYKENVTKFKIGDSPNHLLWFIQVSIL